MCFSCRGGPKWAPHTLGGASVEITWQEGRLDEEYSKSHPEAKSHLEKYSHQNASLHQDASSHPEAGLLEEGNLHPEVDLHPEVNMLALADSLDMRKLKSISQHVQEPNCTMIRNVNYFSEVSGAELI